MKALAQTHTQIAQDAIAIHRPLNVYMHVLGKARTDVRVMREATALVAAGYHVTIVDIEGKQALAPEEEIQGVNVKHIIMPDWFVSTRFKPWFLVKAARLLIQSLFQLMQGPVDIYHAHEERALPACYIAARLRNKPLIFDAHEMPLTEPSVTRWRQLHALAIWLLTRMVPYCTGVITVSPPLAQEIHTLYRGPEVTLIRNVPVYRPVEKSNLLRQRLGLCPEIRIALYQGLLLSDRGLDRLIRAARFLEPDVVFVMLGNGPTETLSSLKSLITSEGVADRVKVLPAVPYEELLDWTASADVGLIIYAPDYSLNVRMCLPNKFFEYMMAGLPVLSSQLDVVADIIKTYGVGQVISSLEPAAIGQAINEMLVNPIALTQMGHHGREAVQHEFSWEEEQKKLILLYRNILVGEN